MNEANNLDFLRKFVLFSELEENELIEINKLLESRVYPDGTPIFFEGDRGDRVYFVKKGRVKAIKSTPEGDEQILEIIQPGDVFGEVVLFGIEHYPATTIALGEVKVNYLSGEKFHQYFQANPGIGWGMLKVMARKLFRSQHKVGNLGLHDTRGRVANLIIDLLHDFGDSENELILDFNRQEMANFIGTSRETVSRTLSDFKNEGLIELENNRINVKDLSGLKEIGG